MFERLKRNFIPQEGDSEFTKDSKRKNVADAVVAGTLVGAAAFGGSALGAEKGHQHAVETGVAHEQHLTPDEQKALQEKGPHGATVTINPEAGHATVNIDLREKPASVDLKSHPTNVDLHHDPVNVDLSKKPVDIDLSSKPVNIDLSHPKTDIDLSHHVTEMKAPE